MRFSIFVNPRKLTIPAGLRKFYRGLRARGKPGKVALTAVMRKLVMQLNAIALRGTPWALEPAHILAPAA